VEKVNQKDKLLVLENVLEKELELLIGIPLIWKKSWKQNPIL